MRRGEVVWILSHFEYLGPPYWLDELVSFVAVNQRSALRQIRRLRVDPGTWWGLQPFTLEADDAPRGPQVLYSRSGRVLKRGYSLKHALKLSRKVRARSAALQRSQKKKGGTKHASSRPS
jgi:hypothetical protein